MIPRTRRLTNVNFTGTNLANFYIFVKKNRKKVTLCQFLFAFFTRFATLSVQIAHNAWDADDTWDPSAQPLRIFHAQNYHILPTAPNFPSLFPAFRSPPPSFYNIHPNIHTLRAYAI